MRRSRREVIALLVGALAVILPTATCVYLSWNQSMAEEKSRMSGYAHDVMRRSLATAHQIDKAVSTLKKDDLAPCSSQELDLMRQLALGSSYLQAIGRLANDSLVCSSLGAASPIPVGKATDITAYGAEERLNVHLSNTSSDPLLVVSRDGFAAVVDMSLVLDTPVEGRDILMTVFVPSTANHQMLASEGKPMPAEWLRVIPKGSSSSYIENGRIFSAVRSSDKDLEAIVSEPKFYADQHVVGFVLVLVPLGLTCGGLLAWAVAYVSRISFSLPGVLRGAARRHEFFVEYQPIVDLQTGRWVGAEALVRWKRNGVTVPPDEFIAVAEASGVITFITEEVTRIVAADLPALVKIDPAFQVSINLSAPDLCSDHTLEMLNDMLKRFGVDAKHIELEATERGFLQGDKAVAIIGQLRARGFSVAIDDFGTGYSSLSLLQSMKFDTLKIDRSFVNTIGTDGPTSHVVVHIIEMAHSLELEMVAEGVEREEQAEYLRGRGVKYAQGWLFSKPIRNAELSKGLSRQREVAA